MIEEQIELWKQWYESKPVQVFLDFSRVMLLLMMVVIAITLMRNIEEVKILGGDPCKICMNKTGAFCTLPTSQKQLDIQKEYYDVIAGIDSFDPGVINISLVIDS